MIRARTTRFARICQGDIIRDVEFIEYALERKGVIEFSKIIFPLIIVLTQDCDLEQDYRIRKERRQANNQDKLLFSVLVAPLYNAEHVFRGEHLSDLKMTMMDINRRRTPGKNLMNNETPRFHYLTFPLGVPIVPSVIDFKHYFSVNVNYMRVLKKKNFVCQVSDLFREDVSQRFASFLSRIGLPELRDKSEDHQATKVKGGQNP
jgi:hypothetical protein